MLEFEKHAFKALDESLKQLHTLLLSMGDSIGKLTEIIQSELEHPANQFPDAKAIDKTINDAEDAINACVGEIISKFNPFGEDLRFVITAIKIASLLERAADLSKNCVKRLPRVPHPLPAEIKAGLSEVLAQLKLMLPQSLALITRYTPEGAQAVFAQEELAEAAYKKVLLNVHRTLEQQADLPADSTHLLLIGKNLERVADIVLDIVKLCHFIHRGTRYEKAA